MSADDAADPSQSQQASSGQPPQGHEPKQFYIGENPLMESSPAQASADIPPLARPPALLSLSGGKVPTVSTAVPPLPPPLPPSLPTTEVLTPDGTQPNASAVGSGIGVAAGEVVGPTIVASSLSAPLYQAGVTPTLDPAIQRHLDGGCIGGMGWILCTLSAYACAIGLTVVGSPEPLVRGIRVLTWLCTIFSGAVVLTVAYLWLGRRTGVQVGLMANFFWWGGIGGVLGVMLPEMMMQNLFADIAPWCSIEDSKHAAWSAYPGCNLWKLIQWILTPGLWEEVFKGIWVLARFKTDPTWTNDRCIEAQLSNAVPYSTCVLFETRIVTCWWRLARTPYAIFLSALAAAAGFQSVENIGYMFIDPDKIPKHTQSDTLPPPPLSDVLMRAVMFPHILWTGYVGIRLAQRRFRSTQDPTRPTLVACFLPSMVLHGCWDWLATSGSAATTIIGMVLIFALSLGMVVIPIRGGALRNESP